MHRPGRDSEQGLALNLCRSFELVFIFQRVIKDTQIHQKKDSGGGREVGRGQTMVYNPIIAVILVSLQASLLHCVSEVERDY